MKRKDLKVGLEVAWYSHSYGLARYGNDCTNDYHWTRATVIDPGPVERRSWNEIGRPKTVNDGVRITYRKSGDSEQVDEIVRPQMLVRSWAEHEAERTRQVVAKEHAARQKAAVTKERQAVVERLTPVIGEVLRPYEWEQLVEGKTVEVTLDDLAEIVRLVAGEQG